MVEARDIIARTFRRVHQNACYPIATQDECELVGTAIIEDLRAAGWTLAPPGKFKRGDRVTKISGSSWTGRVVGTYSTTLTPEGYAVESENEPGSVQIYPAAALRALAEAKP